MSTFTLVHVAISLIGILAGLVVVYGFVSGKRFSGVNVVFLVMTILTSVTGFFFPFKGVTPGIVLGVVSLVVLAVALVAMKKGWAKTYIAMASLAEFLNVLVLIVQSFQKVPALHALAPTGKEPIVAVCQLVGLVVFGALAVVGMRRVPVVVRY